MADELHRRLIHLGSPKFRKRRKHKGETWKPGQRNEPNAELGLWCKHCRSVHPWRNRKTLDVQYEQRASGWFILWVCNITGNVLREQGLVRRSNK